MSCSSPAHLIRSISFSGRRITRHIASAMWLTRLEWLRVYGSRASTAFESASIVCSNSSLVSTYRAYASRVVKSGTTNSGVAHQPMLLGSWNVSAISHAIGTRPTRLIGNAAESWAQIVRIGSRSARLQLRAPSDQLTAKKDDSRDDGGERMTATLKNEKPDPPSSSAETANATPASVPEIASSA